MIFSRSHAHGKDPDARFGRGAGCIAKGYKLHAIWAGRSVPEAWEVTPLNANEKAVAERLIGQLLFGGYDANYVYDAAAVRSYQLVAPVRACKKPGSGKHYQSPHRQRSIAPLPSEVKTRDRTHTL